MQTSIGLWHLAVSVLVYYCSMGSIKSQMSCPPPDVPAGGNYHPRIKSFLPGDKVVYTCRDGFELKGAEDRTCNWNGNWSDRTPFCDRLLKLKMKVNPLVNSTYYANVTRMTDNDESTCFQWDKGHIHTLEMYTNYLVRVPELWIYYGKGLSYIQISSGLGNNTKVCGESKKYFDSRRLEYFRCADGLADSFKITNTGDRTGITTICEIRLLVVPERELCSLPPDLKVPNGFFEVGRNNATLHCQDGFTAINSNIVCDRNVWSGLRPRCDVDVSAKSDKELLQHLFEGHQYDKRFRPVKNSKTTVPVTLSLTPLELKYKIDETVPMKLDTWLAVKWKDEYLTWNPEDYGNIEQLILPVSEVWSPDLSLYHNNFDSSFLSDVKTNVIIRFNGELTWVTLNSVLIQLDEELNNCTVSIMAWSYDVSLMTVKAERPSNESLTHFENHSWKLQSIDVSEELGNFTWSEKPFSIVHFYLEFENRENFKM